MNVTPILALAALCLFPTFAHADDGAASIAAGGIVMKRESRITMAKEVLTIGLGRVKVDYEFRNDTSEDITTEVAFPIPSYSLRYQESSIKIQGFEDFKLVVEQKPVAFKIETKAVLKGRDVSALLIGMGVDIATFGHFDEDAGRARDVQRLSSTQKTKLVRAGIITSDVDGDDAKWKVEKKYYWVQAFPAHSIVHISHQYTPALGSLNTAEVGLLESGEGHEAYVHELESFCIDPPLRRILTRYVKKPDTLVPYSYVDFILTTANTWKTPIEDFTLIVERPHHRDTQQTFVSFCWNGPVNKMDEGHFSAHVLNLVPQKELRIGFFDVMPYKQP